MIHSIALGNILLKIVQKKVLETFAPIYYLVPVLSDKFYMMTSKYNTNTFQIKICAGYFLIKMFLYIKKEKDGIHVKKINLFLFILQILEIHRV